jgi:hypothetical protein
LQQRGNHGVSSPPKTLSSRSQTLSQLQPVEPPQATPIDREEAAGARDPRGGINDRFARPIMAEQGSPESFYWHPCRKSASPLSAGMRAMH